jgi:hypothetical protein
VSTSPPDYMLGAAPWSQKAWLHGSISSEVKRLVFFC